MGGSIPGKSHSVLLGYSWGPSSPPCLVLMRTECPEGGLLMPLASFLWVFPEARGRFRAAEADRLFGSLSASGWVPGLRASSSVEFAARGRPRLLSISLTRLHQLLWLLVSHLPVVPCRFRPAFPSSRSHAPAWLPAAVAALAFSRCPETTPERRFS